MSDIGPMERIKFAYLAADRIGSEIVSIGSLLQAVRAASYRQAKGIRVAQDSEEFAADWHAASRNNKRFRRPLSRVGDIDLVVTLIHGVKLAVRAVVLDIVGNDAFGQLPLHDPRVVDGRIR